jgi:DUF2075 family protein
MIHSIFPNESEPVTILIGTSMKFHGQNSAIFIHPEQGKEKEKGMKPRSKGKKRSRSERKKKEAKNIYYIILQAAK